MFNSSYYARWYYMPILIMAMVTAQAVEDTEIHWKSPFKWVFGITLAAALVFALFPREIEDGKVTEWGLYVNTDDIYFYRFLATVAIALVSLVILGLLLKTIKKHRMQVMKSATAVICVISIIYAGFFIICGRSHSYDYDVVIDDLIEAEIELPGDKDSYRIDVYSGIDNTGMFLGYSTINAFHSVVPISVTDFWEYVGEDRGVASRPETDSYAARSLLGVKYLLVREDGDSFTDDLGEPKMAGFEFYSHEEGYDVYLNTNYLPMGFAYDYYMTKSQADSIEEDYRSNAMVKAILLSDEQVAKYGGLLSNISDYNKVKAQEGTDEQTSNEHSADDTVSTSLADMVASVKSAEGMSKEGSSALSSDENTSVNDGSENSGTAPDENSDTSLADEMGDAEIYDYEEERFEDALLGFYYDADELAEDAAALRSNAVNYFEKTNSGFESAITLKRDNLVFFSIPYDEGWSATVNGKPVEIEKVNVGFMAVPAEAGDNTIEFTYKTPGLNAGFFITLFAFIVWLLYTVISAVLNKQGLLSYTEYPEGGKLLEKFKFDESKERMLEAIEANEAEEQRIKNDPFDVEITDENIIYGYGESQDFTRGFWINTDLDDETEDADDISGENISPKDDDDERSDESENEEE